MEIYCKRTFFNKKEGDVICVRGQKYLASPSTEFEFESGIIFWVQTESEKIPLTHKIFEKYFTTLEDMRNIKINDLLNDN